MTSTYDHRVIQGAESGSFLRRIDQLLQGEDGFYEGVARPRDRGAVVTAAHPASASAPPLGAAGRGAVRRRGARRPDEELLQAVQAATSLLKAYRTHGHLAARARPARLASPKGDPAIQPENLNLTPELMAQIPASILRIGVPGETLLEALPRMREAYCGTIAYQIEHLSSHQQRMWLREMIETGAHRQPLADDEKRALLERLIDVFQFERFIEKAYLGQKMFSIEGLDAIVPMLDELVDPGAARRRRGGRARHGPPRPAQRARPQPRPPGRVDLRRVRGLEGDRAGQGGGGDPARRHRRRQVPLRPPGRLRDPRRREDRRPPLPEPEPPRVRRPGRRPAAARYEQTELEGRSSHHDPKRAVPVLLHGDAAFPGQGVVAETLNLQALDGLRDRRHDPHHPEQPGRLHDRPRGGPLDPLRGRHGEGIQRPDRPRQRRRRRGLHRRRCGWRWPTASAGAATSSST